LRVAFLLNDLQLSGGVGVVVEHARQLSDRHGFDVTLVLAREQEEPPWRYRGLTDIPVETLPQARHEQFDVAVATWWETAFSLFELRAARYAYFVQSLEDRFYHPDEAERIGASLTMDLPVDFITEARWIADTIRGTRPEARVFYVRNGIDKHAFPLPGRLDVRRRGPLRVLVEGHAGVWFKGVESASYAAAAMKEPHHVTLVVPDAENVGVELPADDLVGPLPREQMSDLYGRTDVVLKLSSVEGMFGPPLEGMHRGATCVVSPVTGHDEYVEHGWNGLVTDWDDLRGTARELDLLAADRRYLHFLRTNAVETARAWPSWEQSGMFMAAALRRIVELPPAAASGRRLAADIRAVMDSHRRILVERNALEGELRPIWRVKRHPMYARLKRWRHRWFGRVVTKPFRVLAKPFWKRLAGG
jgi:glycosyltransferase involved in cell wall biosynthesis